MKTICIIPARFASTRLPGKPLALIGDKPMIQWVYEQASKANLIQEIIVATDDEKIRDAVTEFGGQVVMTPSELQSGTDRVAHAVSDLEADVVVNLQGDEPFVNPELLNQLIQVFSDPEIVMATPVKRVSDLSELSETNLVRVVRDKSNFALYFSRALIPFVRDEAEKERWVSLHPFFKHIGIYAYRKDLLLSLAAMDPSELELAERLEQLRALENGIKIYTLETTYESIGVDTPEDLERVNKIITNNNYRLN